MAYKPVRKQSNSVIDQNQYYADFFYVKRIIFELNEKMLEAKTEYYSKLISTGREQPNKLKKLNRSIFELYTTIKPKLEASLKDEIKEVVEIMDQSIETTLLLPWKACSIISTRLVNWIEDSGLTKIDIEQEDPIEQVENESF